MVKKVGIATLYLLALGIFLHNPPLVLTAVLLGAWIIWVEKTS